MIINCCSRLQQSKKESRREGQQNRDSKWQWRDLVPVIKFEISSVSIYAYTNYMRDIGRRKEKCVCLGSVVIGQKSKSLNDQI